MEKTDNVLIGRQPDAIARGNDVRSWLLVFEIYLSKVKECSKQLTCAIMINKAISIETPILSEDLDTQLLNCFNLPGDIITFCQAANK